MAIDRLPALSKAAKDGLLYPYRSVHDRVAVNRFVQDIPLSESDRTWKVLDQLQNAIRCFATNRLRSLGHERLVLYGSAMHDSLPIAMPQARIRKLDDVGHYVMEEASAEVIEELQRLIQVA